MPDRGGGEEKVLLVAVKGADRKGVEELGGGLLLQPNTAKGFRSPGAKSGGKGPEGGHLLEPDGADTGGVLWLINSDVTSGKG